MKGIGIVFALDDVLSIALVGVCPAVILRMRQRSHFDAVKCVEGSEPYLIVVGGGVGVADGSECRIATVVNILDRKSVV